MEYRIVGETKDVKGKLTLTPEGAQRIRSDLKDWLEEECGIICRF